VTALRATNCHGAAFKLVMVWVQSIASGSRVLPHEISWLMCQGLALAMDCDDPASLRALLPMAETTASSLDDAALRALVTRARAFADRALSEANV
jgi:hypothetical protein